MNEENREIGVLGAELDRKALEYIAAGYEETDQLVAANLAVEGFYKLEHTETRTPLPGSGDVVNIRADIYRVVRRDLE